MPRKRRSYPAEPGLWARAVRRVDVPLISIFEILLNTVLSRPRWRTRSLGVRRRAREGAVRSADCPDMPDIEAQARSLGHKTDGPDADVHGGRLDRVETRNTNGA